jgi:hypothetical protein
MRKKSASSSHRATRVPAEKLKLDEEAIAAIRKKLSLYFVEHNPQHPAADSEGNHLLSISKIQKDCHLGHSYISFIIGSGDSQMLAQSNALSDFYKEKLKTFLTEDLKRPKADVDNFSDDFDELRKLANYDIAKQKSWGRQIREETVRKRHESPEH